MIKLTIAAALAFALNVGLTVSDISLDSLHSVRVALERQAAREAAQLQDHVRVAEMRVALDRLRRANYDDEAEVEAADFDLHDALLRASGNPALEFFADALSSVLRDALHYRRAGLRQLTNDRSVMTEVHTAIVDGVLSGDPHVAAAAVDGHFQAYEDQLRALEQGGPQA
jgi:GntR family transcriptional regulator, transcriptional repressor for pyruvate dehydrogenase complex